MPALTSEIFGLQHFASNYCLVQVMPFELEWQCQLPETATIQFALVAEPVRFETALARHVRCKNMLDPRFCGQNRLLGTFMCLLETASEAEFDVDLHRWQGNCAYVLPLCWEP